MTEQIASEFIQNFLSDSETSTEPTPETEVQSDGPSDFVKNFIKEDNDSETEETTEEVKEEQSEEKTEETDEPKELPDDIYNKLIFKLKVNGKESEYNTDQLIEYAQKHLAAETLLEDTKTERKKIYEVANQVKTFVDIVSTGNSEKISEVFKHLNVDFDKLALKRVEELLQEETSTDAEKRARQLEKELKQKEEIERQYKKQLEQQQYSYYLQQADRYFQQEIPKVLKEVGLENNDRNASSLADIWLKLINSTNNINVSPLEAAKILKQRMKDDALTMINDPEVENIIKKVTPEKKPAPKIVHKKQETKQQTQYRRYSDWKDEV